MVREVGITLRSVGLSDEQVAEAAALYANGKALAWFGASRRPAGKCVLARKPFVVRRFHS